MAMAFSAFLISCGGGSSASEESASEAESEAPAEEASSAYSMETSVGVFHAVEDVAAWTAAYESLSDPAGRIVVLTSTDDPNMLAVFEWTESHEAAKEMFQSDDFVTLTDSIGVTGDINVVYYDIKAMDDQPPLPSVIAISHEVVDYDAWKTVFDAEAAWRESNGFKFEALATDADNANMVYLMFSTSDLDAAMQAMGSEDLKLKMTEAGVLGEPMVSTWMVPPPPAE